MNYLAIDTSGEYLTVIASGKKLAKSYVENCQLSHSVILMDEIEKCLKNAEIGLSDVGVVACAVGPGSFTGIRIGVATAKAFAYAQNLKVLPVTTFELLAYNIVSERNKCVLIDARHGNYYACVFDKDNKIVYEPSFISVNDIAKISENCDIVSDKPIDGYNAKVASPSEGFKLAVESKLINATFDRETLIPLYVKKSQAEEEL